MFRKIILFTAILVLPALAAGCACTNTPAATPVPTNSPMATPTVEIVEASPDATMPLDGAASPDAQSSPGVSSSPDAQGAGASGVGGIANFTEGTELEQSAVPEIVSAVKRSEERRPYTSARTALSSNNPFAFHRIPRGAHAIRRAVFMPLCVASGI